MGEHNGERKPQDEFLITSSPVSVKFLCFTIVVLLYLDSRSDLFLGVRLKNWIIGVVSRLFCSFSVQILGFKPKRFLGSLIFPCLYLNHKLLY